jgi:Spy/CpxP family protein refolding chaperone
MKLPRATLIACFVLTAFGVPMIAADAPPQPATENQQKKKAPRIDVLTEELGLDAKQKAAIGKLYKTESDAVKAIRADTSLSKKDQNAQIAGIRAKLRKDIRAILTPEQAKKFDAKK